jgi:tetratricopeptide (TPR) repeat protein
MSVEYDAKKQKAILLFKRASTLAKEGLDPLKARIALTYLSEALSYDPDFFEARLLLAQAYETGAGKGIGGALQRWIARRQYRRVLRSMPEGNYPEKGEVYLALANNLLASRRLRQAITPLRQAAAMGSAATKLIAYTRLGEVFYRLGKKKEAVNAWKRGMEFEPPNVPHNVQTPSRWLAQLESEGRKRTPRHGQRLRE